MNKSSLSVLKALYAFAFAGLIPAFTSVVNGQTASIQVSPNSPPDGAFQQDTGGNVALVFDVLNPTGADLTIGFGLTASGPVTDLVVKDSGGTVRHADSVNSTGSAMQFDFYSLIVPANSNQEYSVVVRIGNLSAGQQVLVGMGFFSSNATINITTWPLGNIQTIVTKLAQKNSFLNLSARATVTTSSPLIGGFVISNDESSKTKVLIRAVGPTLSVFGVTNPLKNSYLTVYDSRGLIVAQNNGWSGNADVTTVVNTEAAVGTFGFNPGSLDSALVLSLSPGTYTAEVTSGDGTSGTALVEVYKVSDGPLPVPEKG